MLPFKISDFSSPAGEAVSPFLSLLLVSNWFGLPSAKAALRLPHFQSLLVARLFRLHNLLT